jgi:surface polysaccharide O-acyltransferase-like enzyme
MEGATVFVPEFINAFFHMALMAAVPTLSVISGFLFFNRSQLHFKTLLVRRFHSVALPSWIWSTFWLVVAYLLFNLGQAQGRFGWANYGFDDVTPMTVINGIFGVSREPFAFQFWFVRDLLLTLLLTPLIYYCLRLLGYWLLLPMLALWLLLPDPPLFFSGNVPVFFTIGAMLALPGGMGLTAVLTRLAARRRALLLVFTILLLIRLMSYQFGAAEAFIQSHVYLCLLRVSGVTAFSALLFLFVQRDSGASRFLLRYSGYSFFIFATHFPLIELLQDAVVDIPGYDSALGMFFSWLLIPLLTISLAVIGAITLERFLPGLFHILNGGRQGNQGHARLRATPV